MRAASPSATAAAFSSASNTVIDPNLKTPTTHQWDFNIQREIAKNTILDIAYVGRRAYHLLGHRSLQTTGIYAKLDVEALAAVALPWMGDAL